MVLTFHKMKSTNLSLKTHHSCTLRSIRASDTTNLSNPMERLILQTSLLVASKRAMLVERKSHRPDPLTQSNQGPYRSQLVVFQTHKQDLIKNRVGHQTHRLEKQQRWDHRRRSINNKITRKAAFSKSFHLVPRDQPNTTKEMTPKAESHIRIHRSSCKTKSEHRT